MVSAAPVTNVPESAAAAAAPGVPEVFPRQVEQWLRSGSAVLIDVREPDEHARERIRGSNLIPLSSFNLTDVERIAGPNRRIVFHCKGGKRSADAARLAANLSARGITVLSMAGGIEGWKKEGFDVLVDQRVSGISVLRQVQIVIGFSVLAGCGLAWWVHPGFLGIPAFFGAGLLFAGMTGTCGLATVLGFMPWNRVKNTCGAGCGR